MAKKLFIETLGCQMNVRDSEHMIAELQLHEGYELTQEVGEADLILINTCSVREKPVQKLFSEIGMYAKQRKPGAKIGVTGCTASHLGEEIIRRSPAVDFVLGARNTSKIVQVLHKPKAVETSIDYDDTTYQFADYRSSKVKAFVNIMVGCDKSCTFCIVPYTRGEEISIPDDLILDEVRRAADQGIKEVILLGQNVNSYGRRVSGGRKGIGFTELLRRVSRVDGIERIRFTSPHPLHMDDEFIEEFASNPKICKNIHMPLQSGSTRILRQMRRGYTKEWFIERAAKIRALTPDVTIGTDIIVAFPGESEEDFADTLDVVREVGFETMFSFKYSPRPLTPAAQFPNQVDPEVADARLWRLQEFQQEIHDRVAAAQAGKVYDVLFEEYNSETGMLIGRSGNNFMIRVPASDGRLVGSIAPVKIVKTGRHALTGELEG
ncbi:MAG: tRNA (N6-isopentenyl adenosine(37)-C2)-methylthiotransferase MiaB [Campylobacterales bacterium]